MRARRFRLTPVALLLAGLLLPRPALAQWPTVVMFYGGTLKAPVFVTAADSVAVAGLFAPATPAPPPTGPGAPGLPDLSARPYISVACFWGPPNDPAMNGRTKMADLDPSMAFQHGRFYPATKTEPAVVVVTSFASMKTKDISGMLATLGSNGGAMPAPAPVRPAAFVPGGPVTPAALEVLKGRGIPVGP